MWVENDKPHNGLVADTIGQTRAKYHHVYKMGLKRDAGIRCDKLAEAIVNNENKKILPKKSTYPAKDDDAFLCW